MLCGRVCLRQIKYPIIFFHCISIFSEDHKFVIEGEVGNSVVPRQEGKDENLRGYERARKGRTFCEIDTGRRWYRADPTRVTYYRAAGTKSNLFCCYFQRAAEPLVREENMGNRTFWRHRQEGGSSGILPRI